MQSPTNQARQRRKIVVLVLIVAVAAVAYTGVWLSHNKPSPAVTTGKTTSTSQQVPLFVRNGQPNKMTERLRFLVGDWKVEKSTYIAGGTPAKPVVSQDITSHWEWIDGTGQRFLQEITKGTLASQPYFRTGMLGYSTTDNRYDTSPGESERLVDQARVYA